MIEVKIFLFNPFAENSYVVWEKESREAAIIDPGCFTFGEEHALKNFILENQLSVKYLFNTHCHLDHIFGNNFVLKEFNPRYFIPELDKSLLENAPAQARLFGMEMPIVQSTENYFSEATSLWIGNAEINFLFTPGHSPGEFSIYFPQSKKCFTGDALFENSIGRTDLLGGNYQILINSIRDKLFTLPEQTEIFPGHGYSSTIGREKHSNPFFNS